MIRHASLLIAALLLISLGCSGHHESGAVGAIDSSPRPALTEATPATIVPTLNQTRIAEEPVQLATRHGISSDDPSELNDLEDVFFEFDSAQLSARAQATLREYAIRMQGHRAESLRIEGMADPRGTQDYNYILGERRAAAVKRYLVNLGMDPDQLSTVSYGSIRLLCHREDETCYQANRRAHLVLTPAGNNALSSAHLRRGTLTQSEASR